MSRFTVRDIGAMKTIQRAERDALAIKSAQLQGYDISTIKETAFSLNEYDLSVTAAQGNIFPAFKFTANYQDYPNGKFIFQIGVNTMSNVAGEGTFEIQTALETNQGSVGQIVDEPKSIQIGFSIYNYSGGTLLIKVYFVGTDRGVITKVR